MTSVSNENEVITIDVEQGSDAWFEWRRSVITATEASCANGTSKYGTPLSVWQDKTEPLKPRGEQSNYMEWGNRIEPLLLDKFLEEHANDLDTTGVNPRVVAGPVYRRGWRGCSLDGLTWFNTDGVGLHPVIIECKTASSRDGWDPIPPGYYTQIQWQMHVTGIRRAFFSVLVNGRDWFEREVEYDESYCDELEHYCKNLYDCIQTKTPPSPLRNPSGPLAKIDATVMSKISDVEPLEGTEPEHVTVSKDDVARYFLLKENFERAEALFKSAQNDLICRMNDGGNLKYDGKTFASYVECAGKTTVDAKLLAARFPEVYEQVKKCGSSYRYVKFRKV